MVKINYRYKNEKEVIEAENEWKKPFRTTGFAIILAIFLLLSILSRRLILPGIGLLILVYLIGKEKKTNVKK